MFVALSACSISQSDLFRSLRLIVAFPVIGPVPPILSVPLVLLVPLVLSVLPPPLFLPQSQSHAP